MPPTSSSPKNNTPLHQHQSKISDSFNEGDSMKYRNGGDDALSQSDANHHITLDVSQAIDPEPFSSPAKSTAKCLQSMPRPSISNVISESLNETGFGIYHLLISVLCIAAWSTDGSQPMLLSLIMPVLKDGWNLESYHLSLMAFQLYFGMLIGSLSFGFLSDWFGRRRMLFITNTGICAAVILQSFAWNRWVMICILFVNGFFTGGSLPLVYSYYTEFMPVKGRGFFLTCLACSWSVGELLVSGFAWAFIDKIGWRWVVRFSITPCLVVFAILPFALTSPRYLLRKGRRKKSMNVLRSVAKWNCANEKNVNQIIHQEYDDYVSSTQNSITSPSSSQQDESSNADSSDAVVKSHDDTTPPDVTSLKEKGTEVREASSLIDNYDGVPHYSDEAESSTGEDSLFAINEEALKGNKKASPKEANVKYGRFMALFLNGYWKITFTIWILWFMASVSLYCIQVFLPEFFAKKGVAISKYPLIFLSSLGNIPGVIAAAVFIDVIGRKVSLFVFCTCCAIGLIPFGFFNNFWLMLLFLVIAKFMMYGLWGILDVIPPENYPTACRSVGNACANSMARIAGMVTPFLLEDFLLKYDSVWPALSMASIVIFVTGLIAMNPMMPETKGKNIR